MISRRNACVYLRLLPSEERMYIKCSAQWLGFGNNTEQKDLERES